MSNIDCYENYILQDKRNKIFTISNFFIISTLDTKKYRVFAKFYTE